MTKVRKWSQVRDSLKGLRMARDLSIEMTTTMYIEPVMVMCWNWDLSQAEAEDERKDLDGVYRRYEVGVPAQVSVQLQPLQAGVHQEHQQEESVDNGQTAEELGEGGADVIPGEDDDCDGVGEDTEDREAGEEDSLVGRR